MKYPALVWRLHPMREGYVMPEIWYHEIHTGTTIEGGKLEVVPHAAMHELRPGDVGWEMELLIRLFPPPAGFQHWKEPHQKVIIAEKVELPELPILVEETDGW